MAWSHEKAVIDGVVAQMQEQAHAGQGVADSRPQTHAAARDIQRTASELWALYEVTESLAAGEALPETLDLLARKLEAILPGTACWFLLRDPATGVLRPQAAGVSPVCLSASAVRNCSKRIADRIAPAVCRGLRGEPLGLPRAA